MTACAVQMCAGYDVEPAVAEYYFQVSSSWVPCCRLCRPLLEQLEASAAAGAAAVGIVRKSGGFRELGATS